VPLTALIQKATNKKIKVHPIQGKNRAQRDASTIFALLCGAGLSAIAIVFAPPALSLFAFILFVCQLYAQYLQHKNLRTISARSRGFYQLGRRLVRLKRNRQRDTNLAVNVLNHMVNQTHMASNTRIWQQPASDFSGDVAITCESCCGKTYLLLADLTGHGIAAAIGATPVATIFQATARRGLAVVEIIAEINNKLGKLLPSGHFCCAAVAVCDRNTLQVCNAGLPDLVVCNESGLVVDRVPSTLLPLGIEEFESGEISLFSKNYCHPHQLYAFTDGLIESRSMNDEVFDSGTVESIIAAHCDAPSRLDQVVQRFQSFSKGIQPHDDISIVEVKIC